MSSNLQVARARFASVPVARLATLSATGSARPHLVPVTFALLDRDLGREGSGQGEGDTIVTAVDHKPKLTTALARLANIAANPAVALLADHYEDDWSALWWVRADGRARVVEPPAEPDVHAAAVAALVERYPEYRSRPPVGSVIVVSVERWSSWSASSSA